jgi:hypothetical protein
MFDLCTDPVQGISVCKLRVISELGKYIDQNTEATGYTYSKPQEIDKGLQTVFGEIPPGDF